MGRSWARWLSAVVGAGAVVVATMAIARADTVTADGDTVALGVQGEVDLGTVAAGSVHTRSVVVLLRCDGTKHVDFGQTVSFTFSGSAASGSITGANTSIGPVPASWPDDTTGGGSTNCPSGLAPLPSPTASVTITAPSTSGTHTFTATWTAGNQLTPEGSNDPSSVTGPAASVTFSLTVAAAPPAPVADAGADQTVDEGSTVTLDASATTGASSFSWAQTGGTSVTLAGATSTTPSFTAPDGPATLTFELTATGAGGSRTDAVTVQVANVAPTATLAGADVATEGDTATYSFTTGDAGGDPVSFAPGSPGCGTHGELVGTPVFADGSFQCRFPDGPASSTVALEVQDDDGGVSDLETVVVSIANAAPVVGLTPASSTVDEGGSVTYDFTVQDIGDDGFALAPGSPSCGSAATLTGPVTTTATGGQLVCTFPDGPGTSTVSVQVVDTDGASSNVATVDTAANNVAPTVTLTGAATANEGDTNSYAYVITDPGVLDTFSVDLSCGANGTLSNPVAGATGGTFSCTFPDGPASSAVSVSATDDADTGSDTVDVAVANVAPIVTVSGPSNVDEGSPATFDHSVEDPGDDALTVTDQRCGGAGVLAPIDADSFSCTYPDGPATAQVSVTVDDGDDTGTGTASVTVDNVAPTVALAGAATADEGSTSTYSYTVSDPGDDGFTPSPSCGDAGVISSASADADGGSFDCTFPDGPADSTVSVEVVDDDDGTGGDQVEVSVANVAPVVTSLTGPASVAEGSAATFSFTFVDPAGAHDDHTATPSCGAGVLSDPTLSSFRCTYPDGYPSATGAASVYVTDSDGAASAIEAASTAVDNVAPEVGPVAVTASSACSVSVSAPFSDPANAHDTYTASIDWGDGSQSGPTSPVSSPVTGTHTYGAGSFTVQVAVSDEDGGSDSASAASFTAGNVPSAILQPINAAGTRSTFKLGSTIPIKITVADCSGAAVSTLAPLVSLVRLDTQPDGSVNEIAATATPTNGQNMRWDASGQQYVFNLSTKNSQLNSGAALSAGSYRVSVSDPSFFAPVTATFDLRK
ncbi:MAG TPA: PxKF domain-containing protein [Ornithinibacter sp.]|nr:PxKF domain-containing protein [Ornithinibacter sp.]